MKYNQFNYDTYYDSIYSKTAMDEARKMNKFEYQVLKSIKYKKQNIVVDYKIFTERNHGVYLLIDEFNKRGLIEPLDPQTLNELQEQYGRNIPFRYYWLSKEGYEALEKYEFKQADKKIQKIQIVIGVVSIITSIIASVALVIVGLLTVYATIIST